MEAASVHLPSDHHHGPPPANHSSRIDARVLGILLFIISELMLFGAFFTAYFFIRIADNGQWPPNGTLPVAVAATNAVILLSSSLTMHWTDMSAKRGNDLGMRVGIVTTFLLGATFLFVQINEYLHLGFTPETNAQASVFFGLTGLHGAHVVIGLILLFMSALRIFRGQVTKENRVGLEVPGIYWHFVDLMWVVVFTTIYVL
jgi:cytochrome c oxidase subunit 3